MRDSERHSGRHSGRRSERDGGGRTPTCGVADGGRDEVAHGLVELVVRHQPGRHRNLRVRQLQQHLRRGEAAVEDAQLVHLAHEAARLGLRAVAAQVHRQRRRLHRLDGAPRRQHLLCGVQVHFDAYGGAGPRRGHQVPRAVVVHLARVRLEALHGARAAAGVAHHEAQAEEGRPLQRVLAHGRLGAQQHALAHQRGQLHVALARAEVQAQREARRGKREGAAA